MSGANSIDEALAVIRSDHSTKSLSDICFAAGTLMENCETDDRITFDDMLSCLDHHKVIADFGARCLYVRTGRDSLGWGVAASREQFVTSKEDWIAYLKRYHDYEPAMNSTAEQGDARRPATDEGTKSEGSKKPKSEPEGRSQ